jgi:hypothetical protein
MYVANAILETFTNQAAKVLDRKVKLELVRPPVLPIAIEYPAAANTANATTKVIGSRRKRTSTGTKENNGEKGLDRGPPVYHTSSVITRPKFLLTRSHSTAPMSL